MSRQRIRSSVLESSTEKCPHCGGTGHVRSVSSVALQLLRALEEMLLKGATHNLIVRTRTEIALYLLNHKRAHLRALEERFQIAIMVNADATIGGQVSYIIEKGEQVHTPGAGEGDRGAADERRRRSWTRTKMKTVDEAEDEVDDEEESEVEAEDRCRRRRVEGEPSRRCPMRRTATIVPPRPTDTAGGGARRGRRGESREGGDGAPEAAAEQSVRHAERRG